MTEEQPTPLEELTELVCVWMCQRTCLLPSKDLLGRCEVDRRACVYWHQRPHLAAEFLAALLVDARRPLPEIVADWHRLVEGRYEDIFLHFVKTTGMILDITVRWENLGWTAYNTGRQPPHASSQYWSTRLGEIEVEEIIETLFRNANLTFLPAREPEPKRELKRMREPIPTR